MAYCNWVIAVSRYTSAFLRSEIPGPWDYHFKSKDFGVFGRAFRKANVRYDLLQPFVAIVMKKPLIAAALICMSAYATAGSCPAEMRAIDAKMSSTMLAEADAAKVKALRDEGEKLHKPGQHAASMKALGDAKKLLGM